VSGASRGRGRFLTFEGGEGAGKSTQVRALTDTLAAAGIPVVVTREPGGSAGAEIVRHVLLTGAAAPFGAATEAALFAAARADHVDTLIRPALERGAWVVSDRFLDSTRVYQGGAGVGEPMIRALERISLGTLEPDLTIVLDLPADVGLARAAARRGGGEGADRFEAEELAVHEARRRAFLDLARREPDRLFVVDASRDAQSVAARVREIVSQRLGVRLATKATA
jgi:dTMP kinase